MYLPISALFWTPWGLFWEARTGYWSLSWLVWSETDCHRLPTATRQSVLADRRPHFAGTERQPAGLQWLSCWDPTDGQPVSARKMKGRDGFQSLFQTVFVFIQSLSSSREKNECVHLTDWLEYDARKSKCLDKKCLYWNYLDKIDSQMLHLQCNLFTERYR